MPLHSSQLYLYGSIFTEQNLEETPKKSHRKIQRTSLNDSPDPQSLEIEIVCDIYPQFLDIRAPQTSMKWPCFGAILKVLLRRCFVWMFECNLRFIVSVFFSKGLSLSSIILSCTWFQNLSEPKRISYDCLMWGIHSLANTGKPHEDGTTKFKKEAERIRPTTSRRGGLRAECDICA